MSNPAVYDVALGQLERKIQREDYRAGLIASKIDNLFQGKDAIPLQPFDYFPKYQAEKDRYNYRKERRNRDAMVVGAMKLKARQEAQAKKLAKKEKEPPNE